MTDTVETKTLFNGKYQGNNIYVLKMTNISDGTGEANVNKLDISTITGAGGAVTKADVLDIQWSIQGIDYVLLEWDQATDERIAVLTGNGYFNFTGPDGMQRLADDQGGGASADILLTTSGALNGGSYDITMTLRLHT